MSEKQTSRTRRAAWIVPTVAALAAAGGIGYGVVSAGAAGGLEPKSAEQILTGMQQAHVPALSGTIVAKADLGLPDLPGMADSPELTSLVSGSHTLRVWYEGADKVRLAKLGDAGETDVIRNGRDAWIWSSTDKTAVRHTLPADTPKGHTGRDDMSLPATPQEASQQILDRLGADSTVTTSSVSRVAGRDAYELVVTPKQKNTLVKDVRVAVDGETMMPLRVQVNSTRLNTPAYEVGFTSLELGDVEDRMFTFTPPAGTTVEEADAHTPGAQDHHADKSEKGQKTPAGRHGAKAGEHSGATIGEGWGRVYVADMGAGALDSLTGSDDAGSSSPHHRGGDSPADVLNALPQTSGPWGSGRVLDGTLFSVVLTDDGRVALGAVPSSDLTAALATSKSGR